MNLSHESAAALLGYYWGGALVGRFVGAFLLRIFKPGKVLMTFAATAIALIAISSFSSGSISGWTLTLVGLFNSIMFPTIFSLRDCRRRDTSHCLRACRRYHEPDGGPARSGDLLCDHRILRPLRRTAAAKGRLSSDDRSGAALALPGRRR